MTDALLAAPLLVPLGAALVGYPVAPYRRLRHTVAVIGSLATLAVAVALLALVAADGIQASHLGGWPRGIAIPLVADLLSASLLATAAAISLAVTVFALGSIDEGRQRFGFFSLLHVLVAGIAGAFLTGDLFNLYVWVEVVLIASFVLLALGSEAFQVAAAVKYVVLNLIGTLLILTGIGLLYGTTGTLNLAALALLLEDGTGLEPLPAIAMLFLAGFGIKAALFPFFLWLPDTYPAPPPAVAALFAGLLDALGVYALLRLFSLMLRTEPGAVHGVLLALAAGGMVLGAAAALVQQDMRRLLAFLVVSQVGFPILGLGLMTPLGLAGSAFYLAHHMVVGAALFLAAGLAYAVGGAFRLPMLGGLYRSHLGIAALFAVPALSAIGMPPFSGFFAKVLLVRAALEAEAWAVVAAALVGQLLAIAAVSRLWREVYWKPEPGPLASGSVGWQRLLPAAALAVLTLGMGLAAGPLLDGALTLGAQLVEREAYIQGVLR